MGCNDSQDENSYNGQVFSEKAYYPVPCESKLSYSRRNNSALIIRTDLLALIVKLTSPVDAIDYPFLSDFFLSYRKFLVPAELLDLLECRLQWAFDECLCGNAEREKIGQIASVRTFVVLRHWILNYFAQDFLTDAPLRQRFVIAINALHWQDANPVPKLIQGIVINIKKSWVFCLKLMWEDVAANHWPPNASEWLNFKIRDIESDPLSNKDGKRLSFYALQSSQNPDFRNRSVLSLYVSKENFQLPENNAQLNTKLGAKLKERTASMFLFPQDNLPAAKLKAIGEPTIEQSNANYVIPRSNSISDVMKDLHYPATPSVDKVIPPTPAKNVEFVLRSSYLPSQTLSDDEKATDDNTRRKKDSHSNTGMMGLLSKWRHNHNISSANQKARQQSPSLEIENFIKLVFSITSLDSKEDDAEKLINNASSRFDILSARTIDEVEYFVAVENDLLSKISNFGGPFDVPNEAHQSSSRDGKEEVSVMDNLNLYKTVSFLASSVISLSKTLQHHQVTSPSYAARERRRVNSTDGFFRSNKSAFKVTDVLLRSNTISPVAADRPRKLVFHGEGMSLKKTIDIHSKNGEPTGPTQATSSSRSTPNLALSVAQTKTNTLNDRSGGNSPTRLVRISSDIAEVDDTFSRSDHASTINTTDSEVRDSIHHSPVIKRKEGLQNLREFNFEENIDTHDSNTNKQIPTFPQNIVEPQKEERKPQNRLLHEIDHLSDNEDDNSSFFTSNDDISIREESKHFTPASSVAQRSVTNSSGRISIVGRRSQIVSQSRALTQLNFVMNDETYVKLDGELMTNQEEIRHLEERTSAFMISSKKNEEPKYSQTSLVSSVPTDRLFSSRNASPNKINGRASTISDCFPPGNKIIRLSSIPSIHSIVSGDSFSSFHTMGTFEKDSTSSKNNTRSEVASSLQASDLATQPNDSLIVPDATERVGNKYLFSPDSESLDYASPEKNVEDLKNKFISPAGSETQSFNEEETKEEDERNEEQQLDALYREKHQNEHHRRSITPIVSPYKTVDGRLNKFAKLTDESLHGDPVNITLMKLEGTFTSKDKGKNDESIDMEKLRQRRLSGLGPKERRSFLIEKRRRVKSEIPFTPHAKENDKDNGKTTEVKIAELLQNYKLHDTRLHVTNADQHVPFILMYDSKSIAEQLTLVEREILNEIDWKDLLDLKVNRKVLSVTSWLQLLLQNVDLSGIDLAIARFNLTVDWIISEIVLTTDNKLRRNTIQKFIHVAEHCKVFQNYNTLMQIVLALSSLVVQSFRDAWRLIEPGDVLTWESLKNIPSLEKNYYNIRMLLNDIDPIRGCIPFIVVYLSDLTLNSEKNNWIVMKQVLNYSKFQTNVQIVKNFIQRAQWSKFYTIKINEELLSKCVYISCLSQEEISHLRETKQ
ncbi:LANO_0C02212g1_1 [Lachancea nothofagi CBS 11611]|uniref:Guanine nucleotide exchange factor LTE1 n=1 Tax=Lachancea nothofagi CBS 11611 TaxID=1266666 RepID=A0A1G4J4R3_9SACH|nr:LANO_0C02212g1_1 [Lachancea nothofagi CBS 11611]